MIFNISIKASVNNSFLVCKTETKLFKNKYFRIDKDFASKIKLSLLQVVTKLFILEAPVSENVAEGYFFKVLK